MTLTEAYDRLFKHFGTHSAAAQHLKMTQQHYNALRNGRVNLPRRTADYILMKAQEFPAEIPQPVSAQAEEEA